MKTVYVVCAVQNGRVLSVVCVCEDETTADDLAARIGGIVETVVFVATPVVG